MSVMKQQAHTPPAPRRSVLLPSPMDDASRGQRSPATYYGRPIVKKPTWKWPIPLYFFLGGVAGGAALIGAVAALFGGERHRGTVRRARYLTLALAMLCPLPLIQDLGRPMRFHHMLRVLKVASPLSVGTWILSAFGVTSGVLAARQAADDDIVVRRLSRLGRLLRALPTAPFEALHGLLGIGLGGYTGVLLAVTAVPVWAAAGILLGPLFLATGVASGAAALILLGAFSRGESPRARAEVEAVETVATAIQIAVVASREALVPVRINEPLRSGAWGSLYRFGAVGGGMFGPLALRMAVRLSGRRTGAVMSATASTLTLLGALAERYAITEAGKRSADDPLAYQELTAGTPGEARPTPARQAWQARQAPHAPAFTGHVIAPEATR